MTEIKINGSERDVVRLFHLDLPREAVNRFTAQAGTGEWPLKYAFGASSLRGSFVDVVDLRDLDPMTLSQYLAEAYSVPSDELKAMKTQIDALKGHAIIMPSQAFNSKSQTLTIATPLRWIGSFGEVGPEAPGPRLRAKTAKPQPSATPATGAAGGSIMLKVLVAAMALAVVIALVMIVS